MEDIQYLRHELSYSRQAVIRCYSSGTVCMERIHPLHLPISEMLHLEIATRRLQYRYTAHETIVGNRLREQLQSIRQSKVLERRSQAYLLPCKYLYLGGTR